MKRLQRIFFFLLLFIGVSATRSYAFVPVSDIPEIPAFFKQGFISANCEAPSETNLNCIPHNGLVILGNQREVETANVYACINREYVKDGITYEPHLFAIFSTGSTTSVTLGTSTSKTLFSFNGINYLTHCFLVGSYNNISKTWTERSLDLIKNNTALHIWQECDIYDNRYTCCLNDLSDYILSELRITGGHIYNYPLAYSQSARTCSGITCPYMKIPKQTAAIYVQQNLQQAKLGPPRPAPFRLKLRLQQEAQHEVIYMTDNKCVVNMQAEGSRKPLQCGDGQDEAVIYYSYGVNSLYYGDIHLWVTDTDNPCSNLLGANYTLYDTQGNKVCQKKGSVLVPEYGETFSPPVSFNPDEHDWGAFNWFKTVVSFFADLLNGIAEWFFDLWQNFLNLIIPEEGFLTDRVDSLRSTFETKFPIEQLKSDIKIMKEAFSTTTTNNFDNISVNWKGSNVTLLDFSIIHDNIDTIRPIAQGITILSLVFLVVNLIVKMTAV